MIIHIFPDTDSTLYEVSASMNTGIDQVLELEKVVTKAETPKKFNSRIVPVSYTHLTLPTILRV